MYDGALFSYQGDFLDYLQLEGMGLHRDYQQILPALSAMEEKASYSITVSDYAALCSLKTDHFSHKFKKLIGVSPVQYLSDHLMQKAAELLTTTAASITAETSFKVAVAFTEPTSLARKKSAATIAGR